MKHTLLPKYKTAYRRCEACDNVQADLGDNVTCEDCDECEWTGPFFYQDEDNITVETMLASDYKEEGDDTNEAVDTPPENPLHEMVHHLGQAAGTAKDNGIDCYQIIGRGHSDEVLFVATVCLQPEKAKRIVAILEEGD